jgi:hypothetical protein
VGGLAGRLVRQVQVPCTHGFSLLFLNKNTRMSVVNVGPGPQAKRARTVEPHYDDSDDDEPQSPLARINDLFNNEPPHYDDYDDDEPQSPLAHINDLFNKFGYTDSYITVKRHVGGTLRGEDRVKVRLHHYQTAYDSVVRAAGVVASSTVASYAKGMDVTLVLHADGNAGLSSTFSDAAEESFTKFKFKGKLLMPTGRELVAVVRVS